MEVTDPPFGMKANSFLQFLQVAARDLLNRTVLSGIKIALSACS
jgi:hypothetical protein